MQIEFARRTRCGVCGFAEVRTDEVVDPVPVFLAECPRCDHRWTEPRPAPVPIRARTVRHVPFREVVTAA
jgi:hypothetical protein